VGHFNGDEHPDLVVASYLINLVTINLNHGATTTTSSSAAQTVYGRPLILTASITAASGIIPTGSVP